MKAVCDGVVRHVDSRVIDSRVGQTLDQSLGIQATSNERAQAHLFSQFKTPSDPFLVPRMYVFIFATNL